jgi:hypothetical protein
VGDGSHPYGLLEGERVQLEGLARRGQAVIQGIALGLVVAGGGRLVLALGRQGRFPAVDEEPGPGYGDGLAAHGDATLDEVLGLVPDQVLFALRGLLVPVQVPEKEKVGQEPVTVPIPPGIKGVAGVLEDQHLARLRIGEAGELFLGEG